MDIAGLLRNPTSQQRVVGGLVSQGLNSLGNFLALLFAIHSLPVDQFGRYALVFGIYVFALAIERSVVGDVVVIHLAHPLQKRLVSGALMMAFVMGLASSFVLILASVFFASARNEALVLAFSMPFLLVQDAYRYVAISNGHSFTAAILDGAWLILWAAAVSILMWSGAHRSAGLLMILWALGGLLEGALALKLGQTRLTALRAYFVAGRPAFRYFVAEQGVSSFTAQATGWIFAAAYGADIVGALRASQTMFGPLNVLFNAVRTTLGRELRSMSTKAQIRLCVLTATILALLGCLVALILSTSRLSNLLLGENSIPASKFIAALGVQQIGLAAMVGAVMLARATAQYRRVLHFRVAVSLIELLIVSLGSWVIAPTSVFWLVALCWLIIGPIALIRIARGQRPPSITDTTPPRARPLTP